MTWRTGLVGAAAAMMLAAAPLYWAAPRSFDPANPRVTLADIEATVSQKYPVPEVTEGVLAQQLNKPDVLLFDVREPDEFDQSHLPGARRIDPEMTAQEFLAAYGPQLKDKTVVFYCAVGVRSGRMLTRVQSALPGYGVKNAYNLRGGIFRWNAAGQTVVAESAGRSTTAATVHPYDASWGKLLDRTRQSKPAPAPTQ